MKHKELFLAASLALTGCSTATNVQPELADGVKTDIANTTVPGIHPETSENLSKETAVICGETRKRAQECTDLPDYYDKVDKSIDPKTIFLHADIENKIPPEILRLNQLKILLLQTSANEILNLPRLADLKNLEALTLDLPGNFNFKELVRDFPSLPKLQNLQIFIKLKPTDNKLRLIIDLASDLKEQVFPGCKVEVRWFDEHLGRNIF